MQRRLFLGGVVALALVSRIAPPAELPVGPDQPATVAEAALSVRRERMRELTAVATNTVAEVVTREGASPTWKLLGTVSELRAAACRGGLSRDQYQQVLELSFQDARRDYLAAQKTPRPTLGLV